MLTQLTSRLASQLNDLTIQVVKEDWTLTSSPLTPSSRTPFPGPVTGAGTKPHSAPLPVAAAAVTTLDIHPQQRQQVKSATSGLANLESHKAMAPRSGIPTLPEVDGDHVMHHVTGSGTEHKH